MKKLGWRATVIINDLQKEEVSKGVHTNMLRDRQKVEVYLTKRRV